MLSGISAKRVTALFKKVVRQPTAPFHEGYIRKVVVEETNRHGCFTLREDRFGNVTVRYGEQSSRRTKKPPTVFLAHMDHPGFEVVCLSGAGRQRRATLAVLGGGPQETAVGTTVRTFGPQRTGRGVLLERLKRKADGFTRAFMTMRVTGGTVAPGDFAMYDLVPFREEGKLLHTRAADDLAGVAALLALMEFLATERPRACPVWLFFSRAEEGGFFGTLAAARTGTIPRKAVSISLEASSERAGAGMGEGVVVRVGDKASIFTPAITGQLVASAETLRAALGSRRFAYQRKLMDTGTCEATPLIAYGFRAGALCVPLRNYHNRGPHQTVAPEVIHRDDLTAMVRLMAAFAIASAHAPTADEPADHPMLPRLENYFAISAARLQKSGWHV
jgi:endoglucanase